MAFSAKILLDSTSPENMRLTTFEITFPRFILAEFNTHRAFSRNSASSRAIPTRKIIERVKADPFIPDHWGKNQPGMQADAQLSPAEQSQARAIWLQALKSSLISAHELSEIGAHKQLVNRLLEPFMWHTALVTATEWDNYFALRAHISAQPEIRTIAELMQGLYQTHEPTPLPYGNWHLPLVRTEEYDETDLTTLKKVSAGRCARVSYLTHDGRRDLEADVRLHDQLAADGHMSPLEHIARPMTRAELATDKASGNFRGWHQYRKDFPSEQNYGQIKAKPKAANEPTL